MIASRRLGLLAGVSVVALLAVLHAERNAVPQKAGEMRAAAVLMAETVQRFSAFCDSAGIAIDPSIDPNGTGLIGPELTELTTTVGHLAAKRTSLNPQMAALVVSLLNEADVTAGDTVLVGASGSFPGLLVAVFSACRALSVVPVAMLSVGASSYGCTRPELDLIDFYAVLRGFGLVHTDLLAVSLGGDEDIGLELDAAARQRLIAKLGEAGPRFICEPSLPKNVALRLGLIEKINLKAFINCGGSHVNLGTDAMILKAKPGLHSSLPLPVASKRGMMQALSARGVPVIHLLYLRGLALRYGLHWDPVPLPAGETVGLPQAAGRRNIRIKLIAMFYFIVLSLGLVTGRKSGKMRK